MSRNGKSLISGEMKGTEVKHALKRLKHRGSIQSTNQESSILSELDTPSESTHHSPVSASNELCAGHSEDLFALLDHVADFEKTYLEVGELS